MDALCLVHLIKYLFCIDISGNSVTLITEPHSDHQSDVMAVSWFSAKEEKTCLCAEGLTEPGWLQGGRGGGQYWISRLVLRWTWSQVHMR